MELSMQKLPTSLVRPNPWNTNMMSPDNWAKLIESVKRFGLFKPVLVRELDGEYQIIGGQHRWEAVKELGIEEVPVINLGPIDDAKAKEIGLVDNGRYGADDTLALAELLKELSADADLSTFLPYSQEDLSALFTATDIDLDSLTLSEDDTDTLPDEPVTDSKPVRTHQVMRFKVPIDDADTVSKIIKEIIETQGYTDGSSLENAGDALVYLCSGKGKSDEAEV